MTVDAALARCGLLEADLCVRPFNDFLAEAPGKSLEIAEKRFRQHQEDVARNVELVFREQKKLQHIPKPPAESNALSASETTLLVSSRRCAREKEDLRRRDAAQRKKQNDDAEYERARQLAEDTAAREQARRLQLSVIAELNAERAKARGDRDQKIAELRALHIAALNSPRTPSDTGSDSASNLSTSRKNRAMSVADSASQQQAKQNRQRVEEGRQAKLLLKYDAHRRRQEEHSARQLMTSQERAHRAEVQAAHEREVLAKSKNIETARASERQDSHALAASRGSLNASKQRDMKETAAAAYAEARERCLQHAAAFREAKQEELHRRQLEKRLAEAARVAELKREADARRMQQADEQERRFQHREEMSQRLRRAQEVKSEEIKERLAKRSDAASARRDHLVEAVYN